MTRSGCHDFNRLTHTPKEYTDARTVYSTLFALRLGDLGSFAVDYTRNRISFVCRDSCKCKELKCDPIAIGGIEDHAHLLTRFPTTLAVATLVKEVKGASSHLTTHKITPDDFFKWQGAYGAFTVSKSVVKQVCDYVLNQKIHHSEQRLFADLEKCETEDN